MYNVLSVDALLTGGFASPVKRQMMNTEAESLTCIGRLPDTDPEVSPSGEVTASAKKAPKDFNQSPQENNPLEEENISFSSKITHRGS